MQQAGAAIEKGLTFLKLEFLHILCSHEHHVVLNLPFPIEMEEKEQVSLSFSLPFICNRIDELAQLEEELCNRSFQMSYPNF